MNKHKKMLFLAVALVTVLILVSAVNATNTTDKSIDNTISEKTSTQASTEIKETTTKNAKFVKDTSKEKSFTNNVKEKQIQKENKTDKNTKKDSITIDGIEYTNIIENEVFPESEYYTIPNTFINNCIYNGDDCYLYTESPTYINNSSLSILANYASTTILNNSNIRGAFLCSDKMYVYNSHLDGVFYLSPDTSEIYIDDNTTFGENFVIGQFEGKLYTNNTRMAKYLKDYGIYMGENEINNTSIQNDITITQDSVLTVNNCILDSNIMNAGTLIIDESTSLGNNFGYSGNGKIITNNTHIINKFKEMKIYVSNQTIKDQTLNSDFITNGDIKIINCTINAKITNHNTLTIINSTINNRLQNNDKLTIINSSISNNTIDLINNVYGNLNLIGFLINNGNTTLINCKINNNTFNMQNVHNTVPCGVIVNNNNAILTLMDSEFENNKLQSSNLGINSLIYNLGVISKFDNCKFINNNLTSYINKGYSSIFQNIRVNALPDDFILTVSDSLFENNTANVFEAVNMICTNSNFINNKYIYLESGTPGGGEEPSGMAITASNLNVDNCTFDANGVISKHQYLDRGGYGGAINAINLTVNNSKFTNNIVNTTTTWNARSGTGAAISVVNGEIYNSVFENNYASNPTEAIIPTIGYESSDTGMSMEGGLPGSGADIYSTGNIIIKNNVFSNSYAKNPASSIYSYVLYNTSTLDNITIVNNTFNQCKSSMDTIVIEHNGITDITLENNSYTNTTINDELNLDVPNKIYAGEPITITGTYNILNTSFYDADILEQNKFNVFVNNELYQTVDTLEFTITPTAGNMIITVQPTISQTRKSVSIRPSSLTSIIITPENYSEYIFEGKLLGVTKDTKVIFQGTFTDKGDIVIDTSDIILDGSNATFTNTIFLLEASGITIQNMFINNTETEYPIQNSKDNNIITNNTISLVNTDGKTAAIYNKANNTIISKNKIFVDGPAYTINYSLGYGVANTQAILLLGGDQNIVEYNNIEVTSSETSTVYGTVEGITNHNQATNTQIRYNNITVGGNGKFNYAINTLANVENINITGNNILVTGERYAAGIQAGNNAQNIVINNNNIKCICQNTTPVDEEAITYGIITTNMGSGISTNINITDNTIDLTGTVNYGIEVYQTTNTVVDNNNITATGLQSMGIGYAHSPNAEITNNNIKTSGDSSIGLAQVTEEIEPANVGIQVQQDSNNILITDNTVETYDKAGQDTAINVDSTNVTVKDNKLTSSTKTGDNAVNGQQDTTIEDNNAIEQESTTQTTTEDLTIGDSTTLTAQFYDDTYTPINDGKAIFKVNGKTLRDNQGNVIYADVINGRAELPNVNITQEWTKEGTTIQAVYVGDDNNDPITTEPTTVTVTKPEATITIDAPTEATAGTTITLKATVTDGDKTINSGRVAFKLNGKTLKNADGKALYANVENGVATIEYTIPEKTKAKEYTLTAIFTDTKYDRVEAENKLNVVKA